MGCSASKGSTRKRTTRESWYAPLSRSTSAPISYIADVEEDNLHFEGSPSSSYCIIERGTSNEQGDRGTLVAMLQEDKRAFAESAEKGTNGHVLDASACERRKRFAFSKAHSTRYSSTLNPVKEVPEIDINDVETINSWELMKGLDQGDGSTTSSPFRATPKHSVFEKSLSFNKFHELDSCFVEMGSPAWCRYFSEQDTERTREHEKLSPTEEEANVGAKETESTLTSPARSPLKSPMRNLWKTPVRSPLKSPMRSPCKSPLTGVGSPLFDPSLLAKFEQAVHATALPQDEWLSTYSNTEGSMTTSSSSFTNRTWGLSETSSDAESSQSTLKEYPAAKNNMLYMVSPWNKDVRAGCTSYELESFEPRCPPKGEDNVVLYFTSLRGVRKTYEDCCVLRRILCGLGVCVDERDVWMHLKFREELTKLVGNKGLQVPRLFIKGRYIGGVEDVCQLHEDGFLIRLIEGLPCFGVFRKACEGCGDMRFVPCVTCCGSCKVLDELDQVMRCSECNENGLIMCPLCS